MRTISIKLKDYTGVAVILTEDQYLLWWDYRNRPEQRKFQSKVFQKLRFMADNKQLYMEDKFKEFLADKLNVDKKYIISSVYYN